MNGRLRGSPLPIKARLTLWYVGLLAVILTGIGAALLIDLNQHLLASTDQSLRLASSEIAMDYREEGGGAFLDVTDASLGGLPLNQSIAQILGSNGEVVVSGGNRRSSQALLSRAEIRTTLARGHLEKVDSLGPPEVAYRLLAMPLAPKRKAEVLVVGTSLEPGGRSLRTVLLSLFIAGPIGLIAAGAGGWWLANKGLRPVANITTQAQRIGQGSTNEQIDVPRVKDELQRLALTLNWMLQRLRATRDRERQFLADASHELRTPLAIMRSEVDVALLSSELEGDARETLTSVGEEIDRMSRLVEDLLTLARIDEGKLELLIEPVDLAELASSVAGRLEPLAAGRGIAISLSGRSTLVMGDRRRIEQVVTNLFINALDHSPEGTVVEVETWPEGDDGRLAVKDRGSGIAAEALPLVFKRFYRTQTHRHGGEPGGSGLGLAICKETVEAHKGRIWVRSDSDRGSTFTFALPRVPA
jgi:signal transduction histidine kinase